jgi:hypothetical protein
MSFAVILQLKLCLKYFIRNIHGYIHYPTYWIYGYPLQGSDAKMFEKILFRAGSCGKIT